MGTSPTTSIAQDIQRNTTQRLSLPCVSLIYHFALLHLINTRLRIIYHDHCYVRALPSLSTPAVLRLLQLRQVYVRKTHYTSSCYYVPHLSSHLEGSRAQHGARDALALCHHHQSHPITISSFIVFKQCSIYQSK